MPRTPIVDHPPPIDLSPFTLTELEFVLHKIKNRRAPGPDTIPSEFWKWTSPTFKDHILMLLNSCFLGASSPDEWNEAHIVAILKPKKDPLLPESFRPIALCNAIYKIYASLIQTRLSSALDSSLRTTQYGFRANKSTAQPIFVLRQILDLHERHQGKMHFLFLDWSKAFDSITHENIEIALQRYEVPEPFTKAITALYRAPTFRVKNGSDLSSLHPQQRGIRQGCPLSPYLFIIVLSCLMHDVEEEYTSKFELLPNPFSASSPLWDLEYADDTVLFSPNPVTLQRLLHILQHHAARIGLHLNLEKCEHLQLNTEQDIYFRDTEQGQCQCSTCFPGSPVPHGPPVPVSAIVKYLGVYLSQKARAQTDITKRLAITYASLKVLRPFFESRDIPADWKFTIYGQVLRAIVLYAVQSETLTVAQNVKLDTLHYRVLRNITHTKTTFYHRVVNPNDTPASNMAISKKALDLGYKGHTLSTEALNRKLSLLGHIIRHPDSLEHKVTFTNSHMYRRHRTNFRVGPPKLHWAETAMTDAYGRIQYLEQQDRTAMLMRLPNAPIPLPVAPPEPHYINHEYYLNATRNTVWQLHDWELQRFYTTVRLWRGVEPSAQDRKQWQRVSGR
ncbi:unnamed protein product [Polarella glacialis]|uniref:Reverse transcriptase domain-containing protein n=3 Tax=Polarella glacialis TaxID=89957 RepID=A0A813JKG2_POLGL|nr:unnamed protein product [Polarella glacialis]CAE8680361.1 unnamed protein product [Polarella glacialis]